MFTINVPDSFKVGSVCGRNTGPSFRQYDLPLRKGLFQPPFADELFVSLQQRVELDPAAKDVARVVSRKGAQLLDGQWLGDRKV